MRWYDRLRRSSEIAFVRRRGKPAGTESLVAYGLADPAGRTRVAARSAVTVGDNSIECRGGEQARTWFAGQGRHRLSLSNFFRLPNASRFVLGDSG